MRSISAMLLVLKSYLYMVIVLVNLNAECDDSGLDEPLSFKEVIVLCFWKDFEKVMYLGFQSLIENDTWEYRDVPSGQAVLTSR